MDTGGVCQHGFRFDLRQLQRSVLAATNLVAHLNRQLAFDAAFAIITVFGLFLFCLLTITKHGNLPTKEFSVEQSNAPSLVCLSVIVCLKCQEESKI